MARFDSFDVACEALSNPEKHELAAMTLLANCRMFDKDAAWAFATPVAWVFIAMSRDEIAGRATRLGQSTDAAMRELRDYLRESLSMTSWIADIDEQLTLAK